MAVAPDNARQARPRPARRGVLGRGARGGAAAVGKAVGEARNAPQNTSNATPRIHSKWPENGTFIRSQTQSVTNAKLIPTVVCALQPRAPTRSGKALALVCHCVSHCVSAR